MAQTSLVVRSAAGPLDHLVDDAFEALSSCDFAVAAARCEAVLPWVDACADTSTGRYLRYLAGMALGQLGRVERATAHVEVLLEGLPPGEDPLWRAKALALSAELAITGRRPGRAVAHLAEAEDLLDEAPGGSMQHLSGTVATATALQAAGAYGEAEARLRRALAELRGVDGVEELDVLPELVLLVTERAVREDLCGDRPAAERQWSRVLSLALRWRCAADALGGAARAPHVLRSLACEALAWQHLDREAAALAATGGADLAAGLSGALAGRVEALVARLRLAGAARSTSDHAAARRHLDAGIAQARLTEAGVWTYTLVVAQAEVDVAEHGDHPAVARWRSLAEALVVRTAADSRSLVAEVEARRLARRASRLGAAAALAVVTDALTGVVNRRGLDQALARARETGRPVSACFVDVDRFKEVNDGASHEVGDEVLRRVAGVLTAVCRDGDLVARYGGDEFVVLLAADDGAPGRAADGSAGDGGAGDGADVARLAERVVAAVAEHPWQEVAPDLAVTVSVGVASGLGAGEVLLAADSAMLEAKRSGRGRAVAHGAG